MSQPIDELLISVEIEEGSNLEELHKMLKELQEAGGKIEVEIPEDAIKAVGNKVTAVNRKVSQLIDVLKPLIAKFPEVVDIKEIVDQILENLQSFITNYNEWSVDIKQEILHKLKKNLDNIRGIRGLMDRPTIIRREVGQGVEDKLDQLFQIMAHNFTKLLEITTNINNRITSVRGHITNKTNEVLEAIANVYTETIKALQDIATDEISSIMGKLDELARDFVNFSTQVYEFQGKWAEHIKELMDFVNQIYGSVFETFSMVEQIQATVEGIGVKQGKMNEEILSIITKVDEIYAATQNKDEITDNIAQLLENFIVDKLDIIIDRISDVREIVKDSATRGDVTEMQEWFRVMREDVEERFHNFLNDYFDTTLTWKNFQTKLDKIPQDRTETRRSIQEYIEKLLVGFKEKLDENITGLIEPELNAFLDSLTAIIEQKEQIPIPDEIKEIEERLNLPGVKELGQPMALESLSGFWRELIATLMTNTTEQMKTHFDSLKGGLGRLLEGSGIMGQRTVAKALGFELEKEEPVFSILDKVIDAISGYDVVDLITAMFPREEVREGEEEISLSKIMDSLEELKTIKIEIPQQDIQGNLLGEIKRNTLELDKVISRIGRVSTQLESVGKWNREMTNMYLDPTKKLVEDINSKLDEKSPINQVDDKDRKNKTGLIE